MVPLAVSFPHFFSAKRNGVAPEREMLPSSPPSRPQAIGSSRGKLSLTTKGAAAPIGSPRGSTKDGGRAYSMMMESGPAASLPQAPNFTLSTMDAGRYPNFQSSPFSRPQSSKSLL